jgi:hypothetical protein
MKTMLRSILPGLCTAAMMLPLVAQEMPKTTKKEIPGTPTVKTEELRGKVVFVQGSQLVVEMASGDIRSFDVPASRRFIIDGKELTVGELKPGTTLVATVTTTTTPVTERTTTIGSGKVFYVSGNSLIVTLPNNENRQFKVSNAYRFTVEGRPASVHELKPGMIISAQKIVEEPKSVIVTDTVVTGHAPPRTTSRK